MRYCNNCGNQITDDAKFCKECGVKIGSVIIESNHSHDTPKQENIPKSDDWVVKPDRIVYNNKEIMFKDIQDIQFIRHANAVQDGEFRLSASGNINTLTYTKSNEKAGLEAFYKLKEMLQNRLSNTKSTFTLANDGNYSVTSWSDAKKSKLLLIFLWIFFFPVMAVIWIANNQNLSLSRKIVSIFLAIIGFVFLGITSFLAVFSNEINTNIKKTNDLTNNIPSHTAKQTTDSNSIFETISDDELVEDIIKASNQIGLDHNQIKKIEQIDDWVAGPRYRFSYEGTSVLLYCNSDSTVESINIGDIRVFLRGYEPLDIDDFIVDMSVASELVSVAEDTVKDHLNYPETADFSYLGTGYGRNGSIYAVSNTFKAKNAFGVEDEMKYYIEFKIDESKYRIIYFNLGGNVLIGNDSLLNVVDREKFPDDSTQNSSLTTGVIQLRDGELGEYGKIMTLDDNEYIWFHVPAGKYDVVSKVNFGKLYVSENVPIKNSDGYMESVIVQTIDLTSDPTPKMIEVGDDQHIFLTISARVELTPVN